MILGELTLKYAGHTCLLHDWNVEQNSGRGIRFVQITSSAMELIEDDSDWIQMPNLTHGFGATVLYLSPGNGSNYRSALRLCEVIESMRETAFDE